MSLRAMHVCACSRLILVASERCVPVMLQVTRRCSIRYHRPETTHKFAGIVADAKVGVHCAAFASRSLLWIPHSQFRWQHRRKTSQPQYWVALLGPSLPMPPEDTEGTKAKIHHTGLHSPKWWHPKLKPIWTGRNGSNGDWYFQSRLVLAQVAIIWGCAPCPCSTS